MKQSINQQSCLEGFAYEAAPVLRLRSPCRTMTALVRGSAVAAGLCAGHSAADVARSDPYMWIRRPLGYPRAPPLDSTFNTSLVAPPTQSMSARHVEFRRRLSWVREHLTERFLAVEDAFTAHPPTTPVGHAARAGVKLSAARFQSEIDSMRSAALCLWNQFWDAPAEGGPDPRTSLEFVLVEFKKLANGHRCYSDDACAKRLKEMDRAVSFP